ncbi:unnamed protein product [Hyaloperonospora brassicae]|uniref:BZIP domain-containing protein n=1 Tax=Hyaloperonospora brassicae TaxID=162125 RepID=A0AAV0TAD6_HYABA|nr:unnamed protein product [Hyaloperonospora brassicae]
MKAFETASSPTPPALATADAGDVTDLEFIGATNRDMFSWLLFNSENMAAVTSGLAAVDAPPASLSDDPFRLLASGSDDAGLSLGPTSALPNETLLSAVTPVTTTAPATPSAPTKPLATKRGKKRPPVGTDAAAKELLAAKSAVTNTEGLLRHLESANNALVQKRQAGQKATSLSATSSTMARAPADKASTSSSGSDNSSSDVTTLQRKLKLERNRESARECRRRKREHILGVEERCRQLERENMELRGQLKAGKEAIRQEEREKNRVCEELEKMIQLGASEKELAEKIDNFKEQYSDYGHGRRSALSYHLHQIERLLLPTQVTKMCIWALRQDDSFWQDEEDETSLPVILAKELGLSEDQKKKIQQQRGSISLICENLKSALGLLAELKTEVTNKNSTLDMEMDKLQNILTPTQRAKFIVWVTNNQACMHLLNKLWRSVL